MHDHSSDKDTRRAWLQQYSSPCADGRSLRSRKTELVDSLRPELDRSRNSSAVLGTELMYMSHTWSGESRSSSFCLIFRFFSMFLRLCLNSRIVLVYLLMVVTEEAMQAVNELQAKLEETTSRGFQIRSLFIVIKQSGIIKDRTCKTQKHACQKFLQSGFISHNYDVYLKISFLKFQFII